MRRNGQSDIGSRGSAGYLFQPNRHCAGSGPFREYGGESFGQYEAGGKNFYRYYEATDSGQDGTIGSGSRIGIVSFADTAAADTQLITDTADLKAAVDNLTAGGSTNHAAAFTQAVDLFDPMSSNARVIVMFTDGKTTAGAPPSPVAAAARAAGIVIY